MSFFETVKHGQRAGELIRLDIPASSVIRRPAPRSGQTATGYGIKIPTDYMVRTIDSKWRRVYCRIFSNIGTLYVMHGKERTIVDFSAF